MAGHLGFVVAAYGTAGVLLAITVVWVVADYATQRRRLRDFERSALGRRGPVVPR